jgi:ribonuclease VapC
MVIDTSAIVAILFDELDHLRFDEAIEAASVRLISAVTRVECFAYALARTMNLPLLFKGDDFIHTDICPALPADPRG